MTLIQRLRILVAVLFGDRTPEIEMIDDPEFWAMIAERRKQHCLTSKELKRKMGLVP